MLLLAILKYLRSADAKSNMGLTLF